ncbi:MAG: T9SS type A sorting domain-containing protein [Chryseotalea sp. WA131a]|nr:MAG: T9SS type A sorting domain-containing protein [Chryseotalea sp. WA131a]
MTVSFKGNSDNIKENKTKKSKQSGTAQVRIFDENQKNWIFLSAKDNDELKISVSQLPKGTYYLDVTHSKGDHFRKRILIE